MEPKLSPIFSILLADDDKDDRYFFKKALDGLSGAYTLKMVGDGEELMNYLNTSCEELPDALFLDINMPRKNGIECLAELKQNELLQHIPVVIYSTSGFDSVAESLYQQGAHYYLQKCDYFELVNNLEGILNLLKESLNKPSSDHFFFRCQAQ